MPLWNVTFLSCSLLGNKFTDRGDPGDGDPVQIMLCAGLVAFIRFQIISDKDGCCAALGLSVPCLPPNFGRKSEKNNCPLHLISDGQRRTRPHSPGR